MVITNWNTQINWILSKKQLSYQLITKPFALFILTFIYLFFYFIFLFYFSFIKP